MALRLAGVGEESERMAIPSFQLVSNAEEVADQNQDLTSWEDL